VLVPASTKRRSFVHTTALWLLLAASCRRAMMSPRDAAPVRVAARAGGGESCWDGDTACGDAAVSVWYVRACSCRRWARGKRQAGEGGVNGGAGVS
jgi:hypothetical protein